MLLDTSGLLCLIDQSEPHHNLARELYGVADRRTIHAYVLAEWVALAQARGIPRPLALQFVGDLVDNPDIEVLWVDEELHRAGMALLADRLDKTYSLCDAVSFVLMRRVGEHEALTTDRQFEQEGFRRLLM